MTQIYCELMDCENNEENICHAAAIRLSISESCLTYKIHANGRNRDLKGQGDKLLWDKEFFEDDPLDDESAL